jgi:hypothetical protein
MASVVSPVRAQSQSEYPCPLNSVSTSAASAWRMKSIENANRIRESLRIYNLDCLKNIAQFPKLGWYNFIVNLVLERIFSRICQTVMPGIILSQQSVEEFLQDSGNHALVAGVSANAGVSLC